jgi:hypothetical protein
MSLRQEESILENHQSCVNAPIVRPTESQSSHYRHKRPEPYAVITKTSTTSRDSFMTVSQGPPIGTYNVSCSSKLTNRKCRFSHEFVLPFQLPTTFDKDSRHRRASASFLSNGRSTALLESNATHYKSAREECAKMNIGPGSYNVGYTWRPESPYEPSTSAIIKSDLPTRSFIRDGQYERQWLVNKPVVPILTPREKQQNKTDAHTDIESVKSLPSY